jgi:TolB protein
MRKNSQFLLLTSLLLICGCAKKPIQVKIPPSAPRRGQKIVFDSNKVGKLDLFSIYPGGSKTTNLTPHAGSLNLQPAWDSYGKKIYFTSNFKGTLNIFEMNSDGKGLQQITDLKGENYSPSVSPDGTKLAFISTQSGAPELYLANSDGSKPFLLIKGKSAHPAFSPNGKMIAFVSLKKGHGRPAFIDVSGKNLLVSHLRVVPDGGPAWSPNSRSIAFIAKSKGVYKLETMHPGKRGVREILSSALPIGSPSFSPGGKHLCYMGYVKKSFYNQHWKIFVVKRDGKNSRQITFGRSDDRDPIWFHR